MNDLTPPPAWRLPEGVNPALWTYAHSPRLATEEDDYFAGHPLFQADAEALLTRFTDPGPLVDLGSGAGRHAIGFAARGFPVVAVDLSAAMLRRVAAKADRAGLAVACVQANLCRLGCFPEASFAYALSMFSTLGMIRGADARRKALGESFRILAPGGRMALHAHNVWLNLRDRQGRAWLGGQLWRKLLRQPNVGDRRMTYRGIAGMEVHLFTWPELSREIRAAGFRIDEVLPIDPVHARAIAAPRIAHGLRAGGWIVFLSRPGRAATDRGGSSAIPSPGPPIPRVDCHPTSRK
jgi:ubiquinone/menaquinone biosynthesis C-methylase UbiE